MRPFFLVSLSLCALAGFADTMDHYMNISEHIPQMEMKADAQAQAWARSARHVLNITNESIAETLLQANELARNQGKPLFCLPVSFELNAVTLSGIILETYRNLSSQQSDKEKMTVSQMAWLGVNQKYPCKSTEPLPQIKHMQSLFAK